MEAIEERPLQNATTESVKGTVMSCEESAGVETPAPPNVCHKPNGVSNSQDSEEVPPPLESNEIQIEEHPADVVTEEEINTETIITEQEPATTEIIVEETTVIVEEVPKDVPIEQEHILDETLLKADTNEVILTEHVEVDGIVEAMPENVRFETEILIETNVDDQATKYKIIYDDDPDQPDHATNILNELGQNIELSDVLRSSDISENVENNNCDVAQEVFNKEELLDILEGNDEMEESRKVISDNFAADCKKLETQLALQQLSRLKSNKQTRRSKSSPKKSDKKTFKKSDSPKEESVKKRTSKQKDDNSQGNSSATPDPKEESLKKKNSRQKEDNSQSSSNATPDVQEESAKKKGSKHKDNNVQTDSDQNADPKDQNIVNALVKDWDDDDPSETEQTKQLIEEGNQLLGESEELAKSVDATVTENKTPSSDASAGDGQTPNTTKGESETQTRRLGRVIKKKVIFDPDNPDTFTKSKVAVKKENQSEKDQKEQPTPKKSKTDPTTPRSQSKSPVQSKLQWKKPQPKNLKQNKRLTEIDKLLMDEGAVNMICQLTPEAPQGNKNMKSKAEFIKKIQSSTPEGKEMKFRERIKKESKSDDGDPKRIGGGKERHSLNSSVKSPTVSEDFEAHSADDSIIYRRHSSSSYSSPCMSPRRMSDVETIHQNANSSTQQASEGRSVRQEGGNPTGSDAFMAEAAGTLNTTVINKTDLMSIKEKLNSKLSQALNKRKRESIKVDKPTKMKRLSKSSEKTLVAQEYKYVKLSIDQNIAEICILDTGIVFNAEVMLELKKVFEIVDSKNDISVTLLKTESGTLCSGLDLSSLLKQESGDTHALELAESARLLLFTLENHSKFVCTAVEDRCQGIGLSLVALSDMAVGGENAVFELSAQKGAPLTPGAAALAACGLHQSLVQELVVLERAVGAGAARRGGLLARTAWPAAAAREARALAAHVATQPIENVMLKKQLLRLKRGSSAILQQSLLTERDLFVKYWTSEAGRALVRAALEHKE